ncbi:hypothetical protein [Microbacterium lushaniae]|uniref:Uncharacterized protein n=1 Tax=Microbacterium lushaniae TaxID=2614639 RepID=A0A5J6L072_9MICO|nr:hypothetical protein [Microbacterium lushaniae]QEW01867.1 hypothetical protein F6J85_01300 [Microbacterium lushaniae]
MTTQPTTAAVTRSLTRAVQVLAAALALGTVALGAVLTAGIAFGALTASVPLVPDVGSAPDLGQDDVYAWVFFDSVQVTHPDPPGLARALKWGGYAAIAVVVLAGCVVAFTLARRLGTGLPFSRFAAGALLALGVLAIAAAFLSPALLLESTAVMVGDLGLRTADAAGLVVYEDTAGPAALLLDRFPSSGVVIRHANWVLAGVGGILVVISFAFRRGAALQADTEGLV